MLASSNATSFSLRRGAKRARIFQQNKFARTGWHLRRATDHLSPATTHHCTCTCCWCLNGSCTDSGNQHVDRVRSGAACRCSSAAVQLRGGGACSRAALHPPSTMAARACARSAIRALGMRGRCGGGGTAAATRFAPAARPLERPHRWIHTTTGAAHALFRRVLVLCTAAACRARTRASARASERARLTARAAPKRLRFHTFWAD